MAKRTKLDQLMDELVRGKTPEEILGDSGLVRELTKRLAENPLNAELSGRVQL